MRYEPTRGSLADLAERSGVVHFSGEPYGYRNALVRFARCQDYTIRALAEGIHWADESCRISGALAMKLRKASGRQVAHIINMMLNDGLATMNEVPYWLNRHHDMLTA